MRLAYLINDYPAPSVTFIRREIRAVEALAGPTLRFAARPSAAPLVSPEDKEEASRTRYLLGGGAVGLLRATLAAALRSPLKFGAALLAAVRLSRGGANRGAIVHLAYLAQACVLRNWTRRAGVTHLHVHFASNPAAIALLCLRLGGPTWSLTVHGPEEFEDPRGFRLREKIRGASFVAAISAFTVDALKSIARPEDAAKVHVVHCGVDEPLLGATPRPVPPEPRLVCVGRLSDRKRQVVLLRAVACVVARGTDVRLTLVGDGPMRPTVEREIASLGLADRVHLAGWQDETQVRAAIDSSRVFVLPSSSEGLPVAIMEAFALGRPVITTPVAGIPELVEPGVNGWLVPVDDVDGLAGAIHDALSLPSARLAEMGEAGRRKVLERHDVRRSAERLVALVTDQAPGASV